MTYADKMEILRSLGDLQEECAIKAKAFQRREDQSLALRFERASLQAVGARMAIHAALMAEREALAKDAIG